MSGGHFDYYQHHINDIVASIQKVIDDNDSEQTDEYGNPFSYHLSEKTISEFKNAVAVLRRASVYAQRVDWLVSGDDSEEDFHDRLLDDLSEIEDRSTEEML